MDKKTALITGASGGIGRQIALKFAQKGYRLFLVAHNNGAALRDFAAAHQLDADILTADLSDYTQCRLVADRVLTEAGRIDVLVNNAGIAYFALFQDVQEKDWDRVMNTNVKSVYALTSALLPRMISQKSGCIINVSSMWGAVGSSMEAVYSASKGAVNALTKALGKELAPSGIRVNAVACGVIDTPMNDCLDQETKEALAEEIPMGRFGRASEAADLIYYLASDESSYLTGQVITLDGGFC